MTHVREHVADRHNTAHGDFATALSSSALPFVRNTSDSYCFEKYGSTGGQTYLDACPSSIDLEWLYFPDKVRIFRYLTAALGAACSSEPHVALVASCSVQSDTQPPHHARRCASRAIYPLFSFARLKILTFNFHGRATWLLVVRTGSNTLCPRRIGCPP